VFVENFPFPFSKRFGRVAVVFSLFYQHMKKIFTTGISAVLVFALMGVSSAIAKNPNMGGTKNAGKFLEKCINEGMTEAECKNKKKKMRKEARKEINTLKRKKLMSFVGKIIKAKKECIAENGTENKKKYRKCFAPKIVGIIQERKRNAKTFREECKEELGEGADNLERRHCFLRKHAGDAASDDMAPDDEDEDDEGEGDDDADDDTDDDEGDDDSDNDSDNEGDDDDDDDGNDSSNGPGDDDASGDDSDSDGPPEDEDVNDTGDNGTSASGDMNDDYDRNDGPPQ